MLLAPVAGQSERLHHNNVNRCWPVARCRFHPTARFEAINHGPRPIVEVIAQSADIRSISVGSRGLGRRQLRLRLRPRRGRSAGQVVAKGRGKRAHRRNRATSCKIAKAESSDFSTAQLADEPRHAAHAQGIADAGRFAEETNSSSPKNWRWSARLRRSPCSSYWSRICQAGDMLRRHRGEGKGAILGP